jgi:UDP-N-acetylglucosamine diphosphorylase/glucosamine-1-phosphate N-acetyltransferase
VIVDTTNGPVVIERDAVISSFSRLEGPCWIGQGSQILGAKIRSGTSIGPACRIGGEVEASIIQGWTNKYHDGFLGHAYIGEWVNLGAGASNSDLRNDYGNIRVMINERLVDTGRNKIGCYLGDHTKVGLGTLLNCGTNAGAFSNLLPTGGLLPRFVPSFTNVINGVIQENEDVEGLLRTAKLVMRRRGRTLQQAQEELYRRIWQLTAETRQRVTEEAQVWAYRQSA